MTTITARNISDETRDALAAAARRQGQSLNSFVQGILEREARFARNAETVAAMPIGPGVSDEDIIESVRAVREGREPRFQGADAR
jgi:hypothetical protein